jgi:hypothetical protein
MCRRFSSYENLSAHLFFEKKSAHLFQAVVQRSFASIWARLKRFVQMCMHAPTAKLNVMVQLDSTPTAKQALDVLEPSHQLIT